MAGLVEMVFSAGAAIAGAVTADLVSEQAKASTPRLAEWLRRRAVSRLPQPLRERLDEEWTALLHDTPGPLAKLWCAFGFIISAYRMELPKAGEEPAMVPPDIVIHQTHKDDDHVIIRYKLDGKAKFIRWNPDKGEAVYFDGDPGEGSDQA